MLVFSSYFHIRLRTAIIDFAFGYISHYYSDSLNIDTSGRKALTHTPSGFSKYIIIVPLTTRCTTMSHKIESLNEFFRFQSEIRRTLRYINCTHVFTRWGRVTHKCICKLTITGSDNGFVVWTAPSHYLNQCWNIVNWTLENKFQWNLNHNSNLFIQENAFENIVCEIASILSRPQCVKDVL